MLSSRTADLASAAGTHAFWRLTIIISQRSRAGLPFRGLGRLLAAVGLLLQIAAPTLHPAGPLRLANHAGDLSAAFGEHALCLSGDRDDSGNPDHPPPTPPRHDIAICCFWHGGTALALDFAAHFEPVEFDRPRAIFTSAPQIPARRLTGAVGARAPPIQT